VKIVLTVTALGIAGLVCAQSVRPKIDGPLSLTEAIGLAQQNNPMIAAGRAQLSASAAGTKSARAGLAPQLSANSFATTGSYGSIVSSSPGVMPPYWLNVPSRGFLDQNLMLMLPLFTGGRLQAIVSSASWQQRAAEGELAETEAGISLKVQDAYLKGLVAKQMVLVQEAKVATAQELLRTTQAQFEAGKGIEASVQRVQAELSRAQRSLTSARNQESKALLDLDAAIGADFASAITLTDELSARAISGSLEEYVARAMKSRGRLLAARAHAEAFGADVRSAEAQRAPQLYGQAMGDLSSQRMGTGSTFGLTLSIPIFDGGRINSEVAAAKANRAKAQAELSDVAIAVENEVRQAWLDVETAKSNAASAEVSVKAAQSAYDVVALRVSAGKSILVEQLDALQALTEAKADFAQAIYEQNLALARLDRATGGAK
jgi:outer membrane protein